MTITNDIMAASEALKARKDEVNRLNVFPVPDGDTGTNMSLTMETVVKELTALPIGASTTDLCKAVTHGALMGARGNSGVITSQILRGICEGVVLADAFDAPAVAVCLDYAVDVAFQAVRKPVEGTILTVLRDARDASHRAVEDGLERDDALRYISRETFESVKRTPDLLPVLKENGVVDAGAFGLAILMEGFTAAITGDKPFIPAAGTFSHPEPKVAIEQINDWEGSAHLYCTEFLLRAEGLDREATHDFLASMGDCELIVGDEPDYKVHVHTDTPGVVLNYMTDRGQVAEVHIHNMRLQAEGRTAGLGREAVERKPLGFVAVAAGSGMASILESLGVDCVVSGGQTMNPSTADLLEAVNAVNADSVIILPDNKNIIMAAQAAASAAEKPVAVVPTKAVPAAFTALFCADPAASMEENVRVMTDALEDVRCGEVTTAIKDAKTADGTAIHDGDVIGITDDSIESVGRNVDDVTLDLLAKMCEGEEYDTLTLLAGADLDDGLFSALVERVEDRFPDLEVDSHRGDQPLYPVVMSVE